MMMERFIQPTNDPLALVSNASVQQYPTQSSESPKLSNQESLVDNFEDDRVVVQDVRDRYNVNNQGRPFQRNNARGNVVAGNVGGQNRVGNMNPGQAKLGMSTVNWVIFCCKKLGNMLMSESLLMSEKFV
ncbi:hypothetical protein Tco_0027820 [Tanacetum coccineum]